MTELTLLSDLEASNVNGGFLDDNVLVLKFLPQRARVTQTNTSTQNNAVAGGAGVAGNIAGLSNIAGVSQIGVLV
jgi:hypothetical protein